MASPSVRLASTALVLALAHACRRAEVHEEVDVTIRSLCVLGVILFNVLAYRASELRSDAKRAEAIPSAVDAVSLVLVGGSFSPVLSSLTSSFADNTVENLSRFTLLIHLCAMDNRAGVRSAWASPVSLNAGFAGIILTASRLESYSLAGAFIGVASLLLIFLPMSELSWIASAAYIGLALACTAVSLGWGWAAGLGVVLVYVGVVAPMVLRRATSLPILGPWDLLVVAEEEEKPLRVARGGPT